MKQPRTLLQVSLAHQEEHGDKFYARFKCTACYEYFFINIEAGWQFCPKCGNKGGMTLQPIQRKLYHDNFGVHTQINGKFVHLKAPVFTIVFSFKDYDDVWRERDSHFGRSTGSHRDLAQQVRFLTKGQERFRIVPSKPLPLPK